MDENSYKTINDEVDRIADECNESLKQKMAKIVCDENMTSEEREGLCTEIREELSLLKKLREKLMRLMRLLLSMNASIDEFETSLNETQNANRKKKKIIPTNAQIDLNEKKNNHFAQGITFYKLFWVFFIDALPVLS